MLNIKNITLLSLLGSSILTSHAFAMETAGDRKDRNGDAPSSHIGSRPSGTGAGAGVSSLTSEFETGTRDVSGTKESKRSGASTAEGTEGTYNQDIDTMVALYMKIIGESEVTQTKKQDGTTGSKSFMPFGTAQASKLFDLMKAMSLFDIEVTPKNQEDVGQLLTLKGLCERREISKLTTRAINAASEAMDTVGKEFAKMRKAAIKEKGGSQSTGSAFSLDIELSEGGILAWKEVAESEIELATNNIRRLLVAIQMQHDPVQKEEVECTSKFAAEITLARNNAKAYLPEGENWWDAFDDPREKWAYQQRQMTQAIAKATEIEAQAHYDAIVAMTDARAKHHPLGWEAARTKAENSPHIEVLAKKADALKKKFQVWEAALAKAKAITKKAEETWREVLRKVNDAAKAENQAIEAEVIGKILNALTTRLKQAVAKAPSSHPVKQMQ